MLTDEELARQLKHSFHTAAASVAAPAGLGSDVRHRLNRRRAGAGGAALGACAIATSAALLTSGGATGTHTTAAGTPTRAPNPTTGRSIGVHTVVRTRDLVLSGYTFHIAKNATVGHRCLTDKGPGGGWAQQWLPSDSSFDGGMFSTDSHRASTYCLAYQYAVSAKTPTPTSTVTTAGNPTVYIVADNDGSRTGYLILTDAQNAGLKASGQATSDTSHTLVGRVPADTDQSVLVDLLRQTALPSSK